MPSLSPAQPPSVSRRGVPFAGLKSITDIVDGEKSTRDEFEGNLNAASVALQVPRCPVLTGGAACLMTLLRLQVL